MIKFYYAPSANPNKVALFLEEAGLPYEVVPIDPKRGEQHTDAFRAINPNGKVPALVDGDTTIFDSSAILLYLGEKTGQFMPPDDQRLRGQLLSWLFWSVSGLGVFSGQHAHFAHFAPQDFEYPLKRFAFEMERHWRIVDNQLARGEYMLGEYYTIADMAVWGWARMLPYLVDGDAEDVFRHVHRWKEAINKRPAVARVDALATKYTFTGGLDETAKRHLFPGTTDLKPQS